MYTFSAAGEAELASGSIVGVHLVRIQFAEDDVARWSNDGSDWTYDGELYIGTGGVPLAGTGTPREATYRHLLQIAIADPTGTWELKIKHAGEVGLPVNFYRMMVLPDDTLEVLETIKGVTTGVLTGHKVRGKSDPVTIIESAGAVVSAGQVVPRYVSDAWQRDNVDSTDHAFEHLHRGIDFVWNVG